MKKGILFFMLAASFAATAQQKQSLKDLLYSGKLKLDSTSVIRKDDDLAAKTDSVVRKPVEPERPKAVAPVTETAKIMSPKTTLMTTENDTTVTASSETTVKPVGPAKSNTKVWKEYTDSLISSLKTELLSSKKIKKETYFVNIDYEIGTDGSINILNVATDPVNALLQSEIKQRLEVTPPVLSPITDSSGKARKTKRKQAFTITKD